MTLMTLSQLKGDNHPPHPYINKCEYQLISTVIKNTDEFGGGDKVLLQKESETNYYLQINSKVIGCRDILLIQYPIYLNKLLFYMLI